jgi:cytochrome c oxidase subunit 2
VGGARGLSGSPFSSALAAHVLGPAVTLVGNTRHDYEYVEGIYFPIAIAVFGVICATLIALLLAGRRRSHAGKRHEANRLEAAYALGLAFIVVFLVYTTFTTLNPEDERVSHPTARIRVVAARWSWRFEYPGGATVIANATWSPPVAPVPVGTEVEFQAISQDVIHGFWVPEERFMRQVFPGYLTRFDLVFSRSGRYLGECSVYCGDQHEMMHFVLQAMPLPAFRAWLSANAGKVIA